MKKRADRKRDKEEPRPKPDWSAYGICPKCSKYYNNGETYCSRCGIRLTKEDNRCTNENCVDGAGQRRYLNIEDLYCPFCGSQSTYKRLATKDEFMKLFE